MDLCLAFTPMNASALELSMDENTQEAAFFDYLAAREAAIAGAVGQMATDNVPTDRLRIIAATTTDDTVKLAARIVLYQRGELTD